MSRLVTAARVLVQQVQSQYEGAEFDVTGQPDGFGRNRQITFDAKTSKKLFPALRACADPRIKSLQMGGPKRTARLTVVFVSDIRADWRDDFALAEARAVLDG